jgi:formylglycine-generating enzyme required for sulfatase activity
MRALIYSVVAIVVAVVAGCAKPATEGGVASVEAKASAPTTITTKTGVEMVLLPAGEFTLGDAQGEDDEKPPHKVRLSAFYIDRSEVTQVDFEKMMGKNPARTVGPDRPVERVSWVLAVQYCNMRSMREGLQPCYDPKTFACDFNANGYRLPTEAEWEYACRAGASGRWSFGNEPSEFGKHGWFKGNAEKSTHPVKQKAANAWGLYDMHGNVAEWCNDYYAEAYDPAQSQDPRGPASGEERVLRGGSFKSGEESCRSAVRHSEPPGFADVCFGYDAYGFRCVRKGP